MSEIYKIFNKKYEVKYQELTEYLESLEESDFEVMWEKRPDAVMKTADAITEIEKGVIDKSKTTIDRVIFVGEPFLVDAIGNDLSVVKLTRKKYKLPTGRVVKSKYDKTLISDCRKLYGTPLNGYWKIPEGFLKQII